MSHFACVLVLGCLSFATADVAGAGERQQSHQQINPNVPKSSKAFFGKDNLHDKQPAVGKTHGFSHPYPAVQDTEDFDKDYVKDENTDGGKFQAQMDYDIIRHKLRQAKEELAALKKKLDEENAELKEAKDKWQKAVYKVEAAKDLTDRATRSSLDANHTVKSLEDNVKSASSIVKDEMKDFDKCKKALADAQQRLKELQAKQKQVENDTTEAEKRYEEQKEAAEKNYQQIKERVEKQNEKDEAEAKRLLRAGQMQEAAQEAAWKKKMEELKKELQVSIENKTKNEAAWAKRLIEDRAEYDQADKNYEAKVAVMRKAEAELRVAAEKLRTYRRSPHVDSNGGIYNVPKKNRSPQPSAWWCPPFLPPSLQLWC